MNKWAIAILAIVNLAIVVYAICLFWKKKEGGKDV